MNMQEEGGADTRAKIQALVREATVGLEATLGTSLYEYTARKARAPTRAELRINKPFCFTLLAGGRWLPLSRLYKPLGIADPWAYVDYEAYAHQAVQFTSDPHELDGVWVQQSPTKLWLYSDDPKSLLSYYMRFARLAAAMGPWRVHAETLA